MTVMVLVLAGCEAMSNARFLDRFKQSPRPQDSSPISEQGIGKLAKGELLQAQNLFDQALQRNPRDVHALLGKGLIFQQTGQLTQARAAFEAVLALRPGNAQKLIVMNNLAPRTVQELAGLNLALVQSQGVATSLGSAQPPQGSAPGAAVSRVPPGATIAPAGTPVARPLQAAPRAATMTPQADGNIIARFETLAKLRDAGLVTVDEYNKRRNTNAGALLHYTKPPPANGLDRPVPSAVQISQRLRAISRALELRAISVRQHGAERTMIVDGLMPGNPRNRAAPVPMPRGLLDAATALRRVEMLQEKNLITAAEAAQEKAAIEKPFKPAPAKVRPKQTAKSGASSSAAPAGGPQPAVHIASFRSQQAATRGWAQLRRAHRALLGRLKPDITRVNLGRGKGVFYRLVVGPVKSQADAQRICSSLKRRRQYCEPAFMAGG